VRAVLTHDGARVFASFWSGKVGVWSAADAKPQGEVTPNPPTLTERLNAASKDAEPREAAAAKAEQAVAKAAAELAAIKTALGTNDPSPDQQKQIEAASQKLAQTQSAADKSHLDLAAANSVITTIKAAQALVALHAARETLAAGQQQHERLLAAATAAEEENARMLKDLTQAQERVKALVHQTNAVALKLEAAKTAVDDSTRQLATENDLVAKLIADHQRLKNPAN
jgi:hypothetical protein